MANMTWMRFATVAVMQLCWIGSAGATPAIFWFNDPVGPDDTVLVMGDHLNEVASATVARIPDQGSKLSPEPEQETPVEVIQANPSSLKFVIPKDFAAGAYRFTLTHAQGALTGRVNLPTIYWTQGNLGDTVSPLGWIQLFGRNIVRRSERTQLMLLPEGATKAAKAVLTRGDLWRGIFRVPDGLAPGPYQLRLFNGDGGEAEWVDAGTVSVRIPDPELAESFDVRAYGAIGNGKADCTRAIKSAIEAARNHGGGIVYVPRGRYLLSDTIVIPPRVHIQGERTDLVNLVWPDFASPPAALIQGTSHFSIEDVTIYASNHLHVISGGFVLRDTRAPDAGDIAIRRVRIRASAFRGQMDMDTTIQRMRDFHRIFPDGGPDTIRMTGNRIEVSDCDILGSGNSLRLFKAVNVVISGNSLSNGRDGNYSLLGSSRVVFENNHVTAADLQATGGGMTTLSKSVASSDNIYVSNNTFKAIYGWDREGMTSDGPGGYYFGHTESASSGDLTLLDAPNSAPASLDWSGALVMVVSGRGAGQYARVTSFITTPRRTSITLDRSLQVQPDRSSEITIVPAHVNYLVVDNSFEDTGVGAQIFGTGIGHVIAGNRSTRTSGFAVIGLIYGHFQPCWQIQILDNHILEGNVYRAGPDRDIISNEAMIFVRANQIAAGAGKPPLVQAVIVRANQLDQDAHIQIEGFSAASPGVRDVVVEANSTGPSRAGLLIDRGVASWLARRNIEGRRIGK